MLEVHFATVDEIVTVFTKLSAAVACVRIQERRYLPVPSTTPQGINSNGDFRCRRRRRSTAVMVYTVLCTRCNDSHRLKNKLSFIAPAIKIAIVGAVTDSRNTLTLNPAVQPLTASAIEDYCSCRVKDEK